ncbi:hypothetical protein M8C21_017460, partial [Ambrosia artemisiifolia]
QLDMLKHMCSYAVDDQLDVVFSFIAATKMVLSRQLIAAVKIQASYRSASKYAFCCHIGIRRMRKKATPGASDEEKGYTGHEFSNMLMLLHHSQL